MYITFLVVLEVLTFLPIGLAMDKKTVRTGIVGAGFSASFHYEALRKVYGTNVEIVGVHATNEEQAKAYAERRGIRYFETLEALLGRDDDSRDHGRHDSGQIAAISLPGFITPIGSS